MGFRSGNGPATMQMPGTLEVFSLPDEYRFRTSYMKSFCPAAKTDVFAGSMRDSWKSSGPADAFGGSLKKSMHRFGPDDTSTGSLRRVGHLELSRGAGQLAPLARRSQSESALLQEPAKRLPKQRRVSPRSAQQGSPDKPGALRQDVARSSVHLLEHTPRKIRRKASEVLTSPEVESIARQIFDRHDRLQSGVLHADEACQVLRALPQRFGLPAINKELADRLFKRFDVNGDRQLSFEEFFDLFLVLLRRVAHDRSVIAGRDFFVTKTEGRVWDTWERMTQLGSGSYGVAYLSKHKATGERRVIKAVRKTKARIPVEDIEREIIIMREIDHPHVVRLFMWYEDATQIYLVMEALSGGTLRDVVLDFHAARKPLKEDWIRTVTRQVAEAIAYCHHLRLIHKDLKDENIMLLKKDPNYDKPFAVVIDLGIAEMFSADDPQGLAAGGTPTTMAPEVWLGTFGPKCDVWSLGCVLYELLTGRMPFMTRSIKAGAWVRIQRRGPNWTQIKTSGAGKALCQAMLSFYEDARPSMAECLRSEWFTRTNLNLGKVSPQQFRELAAFCQGTALQRTMILEIASRLPMNRAGEILEIFERFDVDHDASLSSQEFKKTFAQMGLHDESLISQMFKTLDVDCDGLLSFTEFAAALLTLFKDLLDDRLHALFRRRDKDGNGYLDHEEAKLFLENSTCMLTKEANQRSFELLQQLMNDGHTKIRYEDLKEAFLGS